jgi:hypothetical protein
MPVKPANTYTASQVAALAKLETTPLNKVNKFQDSLTKANVTAGKTAAKQQTITDNANKLANKLANAKQQKIHDRTNTKHLADRAAADAKQAAANKQASDNAARKAASATRQAEYRQRIEAKASGAPMPTPVKKPFSFKSGVMKMASGGSTAMNQRNAMLKAKSQGMAKPASQVNPQQAMAAQRAEKMAKVQQSSARAIPRAPSAQGKAALDLAQKVRAFKQTLNPVRPMGGMAMKKMASGGMTSMGKVKTDSGRDGIATKGKTKGKMITMAGGKGMKKGGYC